MDYRKPHELQQFFDATFRHDQKTYDETRDEHAGLREKGTTLRHPAVAPFFALVLLTGMRFGEAIDLE